MARLSSSAFLGSPLTTVSRGSRRVTFAGERTNAVTWWPRASAMSTSSLPVLPVAPRINSLFGSMYDRPDAPHRRDVTFHRAVRSRLSDRGSRNVRIAPARPSVPGLPYARRGRPRRGDGAGSMDPLADGRVRGRLAYGA